jgi:hypothetical protein
LTVLVLSRSQACSGLYLNLGQLPCKFGVNSSTSRHSGQLLRGIEPFDCAALSALTVVSWRCGRACNSLLELLECLNSRGIFFQERILITKTPFKLRPNLSQHPPFLWPSTPAKAHPFNPAIVLDPRIVAIASLSVRLTRPREPSLSGLSAFV